MKAKNIGRDVERDDVVAFNTPTAIKNVSKDNLLETIKKKMYEKSNKRRIL